DFVRRGRRPGGVTEGEFGHQGGVDRPQLVLRRGDDGDGDLVQRRSALSHRGGHVRQRWLVGAAAQVEPEQPVYFPPPALGAVEERLDDLGAAVAGSEVPLVGGRLGGRGRPPQRVLVEALDEGGVVGVLGVVLRRAEQGGQDVALAAA